MRIGIDNGVGDSTTYSIYFNGGYYTLEELKSAVRDLEEQSAKMFMLEDTVKKFGYIITKLTRTNWVIRGKRRRLEVDLTLSNAEPKIMNWVMGIEKEYTCLQENA